MDPNENLMEQREITRRILSNEHDADDVVRLAELVEALDEWVTRGGFLPDDWRKS